MKISVRKKWSKKWSKKRSEFSRKYYDVKSNLLDKIKKFMEPNPKQSVRNLDNSNSNTYDFHESSCRLSMAILTSGWACAICIRRWYTRKLDLFTRRTEVPLPRRMPSRRSESCSRLISDYEGQLPDHMEHHGKALQRQQAGQATTSAGAAHTPQSG